MAVRYGMFGYTGSWEQSQGQDGDWLNPLDSSIEAIAVTSGSFHQLFSNTAISDANKLLIAAKMLKYLDLWGNSSYSKSYNWASKGWGVNWDPGPAALSHPDIVLNGSVHVYQQTDALIHYLMGLVEAAVLSDSLPCLGMFMDDFLYDRRYWLGPASEARDHANTIAAKKRAWGPMNGRPGVVEYPDGDSWNQGRVYMLADLLDQFVQDHPSKKILFNAGGSSSFPALTVRQPRLFEDFLSGSYQTEAFVDANSQPGDYLLCYHRDWNGGTPTWRTAESADDEVVNGHLTAGQSTELLYAKAKATAEKNDLVLCMGWQRRSGAPGSDASCMELPEDWE